MDLPVLRNSCASLHLYALQTFVHGHDVGHVVFTTRFLLTLTLIEIDHPSCECGYTVNSTNGSSPFALFTDFLETDFLHLYNLVLNPLLSRKDWTGDEKLGGAPGLQLWVRGQQDFLGPVGDQMVRSGEIDSLRRDMRYGSFRVGMKMSEVAGTCAAFFWVSALIGPIENMRLTSSTVS